MEQEAE